MRLYHDRLVLRLVGVVFGLCLWALGVFSLLGDPAQLPEGIHRRAVGFGITLLVVGAIAIGGSLLMRRVDWLWYRKPERLRMLEGKPTGWRRWWG
jgi:hypothetical protein